jgi:hypothetical protein
MAKLREHGRLAEVAELLSRIIALGVTIDTGAQERGIEPTSPAYAQLEAWLSKRPADALFDAAIEAIKSGLSVLTPEERADRIRRIVDASRQVADASEGLLRLVGLGGVSNEEEALLDGMATTLRAR